MLNRLIPIPLPPKFSSDYRDQLFDRLREQTIEEMIDDQVVAILDWMTEKDPFLARQKRLLAVAFDRKELCDLCRRALLNVLKLPPGMADDDLLTGAEPVSATSVAIGIAIGIGTSLAAAWVYDEWIEGDVTHTQTITDSDGINWEITTDEDGRIISIKREEARSP